MCRADEVINSSTEDIAERVKEITGDKGAYAALDPLGGDFTNKVRFCKCKCQ